MTAPARQRLTCDEGGGHGICGLCEQGQWVTTAARDWWLARGSPTETERREDLDREITKYDQLLCQGGWAHAA